MSMAEGIDISNWQGFVDWPQIRASGVEFAIVKSSEGVTYTDPYFVRNWQGMAAAGVARGAYHFSRSEYGEPEPDADKFLSVVSPHIAPGDVVALDLESGYGNLLDWTLRWLRRVEGALGYKPLLYTSASFISAHGLMGDPELATYGAWLASWGVPSETLYVPPAWPVWAVHQYTDMGTVPGVAGPCDCNRMNGTVETFRLYGKPGAAPIPPAQAPPREPLDAAWAAYEACLPVYTQPADQDDLAGVRSHYVSIKDRNGFP